jgi:hypothetical protein
MMGYTIVELLVTELEVETDEEVASLPLLLLPHLPPNAGDTSRTSPREFFE